MKCKLLRAILIVCCLLWYSKGYPDTIEDYEFMPTIEIPLYAAPVSGSIDTTTKGNWIPKIPVPSRVVTVSISSIFLKGMFTCAELQIFKNGELMYSCGVSNVVDEVKLPFEFSCGDYSIILHDNSIVYIGSLKLN